MFDYKKIINDNASDFNDADQLIDFIESYLDADGENIKDLDDNINEYADGLVPVYNYNIVKEWQENGECHELTLEVVGEYDQKAGIYKMMMSDLFFWYSQNLNQDYAKFLDLLDE